MPGNSCGEPTILEKFKGAKHEEIHEEGIGKKLTS